MRVVYKKTVLQSIADAKHQAIKDGKTIEKIVLSVPEARELVKEIVPSSFMCSGATDFDRWLPIVEDSRLSLRMHPPQPSVKIMGVDIKVEDNK